MAHRFTWIPIYQELADQLAGWSERQGDLVAFPEGLQDSEYTVTRLTDRDAQGTLFQLQDIDPFTFLGVVNRGISVEQRTGILGRAILLYEASTWYSLGIRIH